MTSDRSHSAPSLSSAEADEKQSQATGSSVENSRPELPAWKWIMTLIGLYLGALLFGLDTTVAADVQTPIYQEFAKVEDLAWVGIGFPMASVSIILAMGKAFDLFDVKLLTLSSIALFEVGSALCGAAPNMNALIVGRVIAGLGGAGSYLGALTYISIYARPELLGLYNALIGLSWGAGSILGPVIGGAFAQSSATWRWAFYINLPLAGVLLPVYLFVFPSYHPQPKLSIASKLKSFDWAGVVLNAATFVLFIVALTFSGTRFAWNSAPAIALWVIWAVCLVAFVLQQSFSIFTTPEHRIFPVHFLRNKDYVLLYISTASAGVVNGVTIYFIPIFFAFTRGDGPLESAVRLLPYIVIFIVVVMVAGGTLPVFGRWSLYYIVGGVFILAGACGMFTVRLDTPVGPVYAFEALIAIGSGLTFQNAYAVMSSKVAPADRGNAIGFINVAQISTIAISLSIAGSLFQNLGFEFLKEALATYNLPDSALHAALGGAASEQLQNAPAEVARLVVETIAFTISRVFGMGIAAGALMIVAAVLMTHEKLSFSAPAQF